MAGFETLSDKQKSIVFNDNGHVVVKASAGSGKTYTVAAKIAHLLETWGNNNKGIAVLSFTNTAWKEIHRTLEENFLIKGFGDYPHFLGTIDSFLNKFIFLPFGHKVMNCSCRPKLVGPPHGPWHGKNYSQSFFCNISYDIDGNFYYRNPRFKPSNGKIEGYAFGAKRSFIKAGYCTQSDANYFSMKLLEKYNWLIQLIKLRFPYIIVDEAQDSSDIQMKIFDHLVKGGLKDLMFIGDPNQAIYEWNDAKPDLFIKRWEEWKKSSQELLESRRSSQNICDFTYKLTELKTAPKSIAPSEVKEHTYLPKVYCYTNASLKKCIDDFIKNCEEKGVEVKPNKVAILFRSKSFFKEILDNYEDQNELNWTKSSELKDLCKSKFLYENSRVRKAIKIIARLIVQQKTGKKDISKVEIEEYVENNGYASFYTDAVTLLNQLPTTKKSDLQTWVTSISKMLGKDCSIDMKIVKKYSKKSISSLFNKGEENLTYKNCLLSTVHGVKGGTFDAVLVLLKKKGIGANYTTMLKKGLKAIDDEELRTVYVAITRPRVILDIAVPDEANKNAWQKLFNS